MFENYLKIDQTQALFIIEQIYTIFDKNGIELLDSKI